MIRIFERTANNEQNVEAADALYATNGLGMLCPTACTVSETLNGEYELYMEHPIDEQGKWKRIQRNCIVVAPVPRAPHPIMRASSIGNSPVYHYYRLADIDGPQKLKLQPSFDSEDVGDAYPPGTEFRIRGESTEDGVIAYMSPSGPLLVDAEPGWARVDTPTTINAGYIHMRYLRYYRYEDGIGTVEGVRSDIFIPDLSEDMTRFRAKDQAFRIYKVVKRLDRIQVYARHISYDYGESFVPYCNVHSLLDWTTNPTGVALYSIMMNKTAPSVNLEWAVYSNMRDSSAYPVPEEWIYERKTILEILFNEEGMVDLFGGEVARDNNSVYWLKSIGRDRGVCVRSGKNLTGIEHSEDWSSVVNRIMPIGKNDDGDTLYLNGKTSLTGTSSALYVTKSPTGMPFWRTAVLQDDECNTVTKLKNAANAEYEKGCHEPIISVSVDFELLGESEEYAQYRKLQGVFLGDTIRVSSLLADIDVPIKMTQYTYDCLTERYTSMTLGTPEKVDLKV